jgi:hypothetical protein
MESIKRDDQSLVLQHNGEGPTFFPDTGMVPTKEAIASPFWIHSIQLHCAVVCSGGGVAVNLLSWLGPNTT